MRCRKCGSDALCKIEFPWEDKGLKCRMCGTDTWFDMIDKNTNEYTYAHLPKVGSEARLLR